MANNYQDAKQEAYNLLNDIQRKLDSVKESFKELDSAALSTASKLANFNMNTKGSGVSGEITKKSEELKKFTKNINELNGAVTNLTKEELIQNSNVISINHTIPVVLSQNFVIKISFLFFQMF